MRCDRCRTETTVTIGSYFNTEQVCLDCEDRERKHPAFAEARRVEEDAVRRGDFNFPGAGLPDDLKH